MVNKIPVYGNTSCACGQREAVCFIGGTRYTYPLDATSNKKFQALSKVRKVFIIGFSMDLMPRVFVQYAHFYLLPHSPIHIFRYLLMFIFGPFLAIWCIFRHNAKVLVAQSPYEGFAAALAKMLAHLFGKHVALVIESHGDFQHGLFLYRRVRLASLYRFLMRHVANFALRNADVLRTVSNHARQQLEGLALGKPIFQFPAWTDIDVFLKIGANDKKPSAPYILYAGMLVPIKGVHYLIDAFSDLASDFPKAKLVIIGREENKDYVRELKDQVKRVGLEGRVEFTGEVSQKELAEWMQKACVFVLPSLSEGLPRVIIEAMATGTPVIASKTGGIPELIKHGVTGFFTPPGDKSALKERLQWVLENPERAKRMGHCAHEFAKNLFSTETYVRNYARVFKEAQGGS